MDPEKRIKILEVMEKAGYELAKDFEVAGDTRDLIFKRSVIADLLSFKK